MAEAPGSKKARLQAIAKRHGEQGGWRPPIFSNNGSLGEPVRSKRPARALFGWLEKIYVPLPSDVKLKIMRLARENRMSQAEFAWVIVWHMLETRGLLKQALKAYRAAGHAMRGPSPSHPTDYVRVGIKSELQKEKNHEGTNEADQVPGRSKAGAASAAAQPGVRFSGGRGRRNKRPGRS